MLIDGEEYILTITDSGWLRRGWVQHFPGGRILSVDIWYQWGGATVAPA